MKKILTISVLISFSAVLLLPMAVSAVEITAPETCTMSREIIMGDMVCSSGEVVPIEGSEAMCCLMNSLYNIIDWIFFILVAVAGIMVVIGAFTILTAGGKAESVTSGRNYIMYAAIGLAVAFLAKAIPGIVKLIVGL